MAVIINYKYWSIITSPSLSLHFIHYSLLEVNKTKLHIKFSNFNSYYQSTTNEESIFPLKLKFERFLWFTLNKIGWFSFIVTLQHLN